MVSALRESQLPRNNEKVRCLIAPEKTRRKAGFFVYRQQITRSRKGSQEDPLIFFTWYQYQSTWKKKMVLLYLPEHPGYNWPDIL